QPVQDIPGSLSRFIVSFITKHDSGRSAAVPRERTPGFHPSLFVQFDQSRFAKRRVQVDLFVGELEAVIRHHADDSAASSDSLSSSANLADDRVQLLEYGKRLRAVRTGLVLLFVESSEIGKMKPRLLLVEQINIEGSAANVTSDRIVVAIGVWTERAFGFG